MDWNRMMREDWDHRARQDAEHFIYTRDSADDVAGFAASGKANYDQLIRPYLPILLNGRRARSCRAVEIGCGAGRMTEWLAREFGAVEALDVSPEMIAIAARRLEGFGNLTLHAGSGSDLAPIRTESADLVFSYIVFQHIPSHDAIAGYVQEAARVLVPGGYFKFQLNGAVRDGARDTWNGECYSEARAVEMLAEAGFSLLAAEGRGTQYFVLTARKGPLPRRRSWVLPGEEWAQPLLIEGFGPPVGESWRPMGAHSRVLVPGQGSTLYLGIYFWPDSRPNTVRMGGHVFGVGTAGDHYFESPGGPGLVDITLDPPPAKPPAFRVIGVYQAPPQVEGM